MNVVADIFKTIESAIVRISPTVVNLYRVGYSQNNYYGSNVYNII